MSDRVQANGVELRWPGKHTTSPPSAVAPTLIETFEPQRFARTSSEALNILCHDDNLNFLAHLLDAGFGGKIRLIYADPPYDSGLEWSRKVRLRGVNARILDTPHCQQASYSDIWAEGAYLQFIYARLPLLRDLLSDDGSLWLHCDHRHAHHLRCLLDEVFGAENYLNTISWRSQTARGAKVNAFYFPNSAQTILVYARNRAAPTCWHPPRRRIELSEAEAAAAFMRDERGFFRTSDPGTYSFERLKQLYAEGRLYAPYRGEIVIDEANRRVYTSNGGNIGVKYYLTDLGKGRYQVERAVDNLWDDIPGLGTTPGEDLGYPTQKTEALLERVLTSGSDAGDRVLDPFCGSGTTPAVAQKLGRRWIACDASSSAIQTTTRRLQAVCTQQLFSGEFPAEISPGFAVYTTASTRCVQENLPEINLAITRIDAEQGIMEVIVHDVRLPTLQDTVDRTDDAWRTVVDSITIDPVYDGEVLRATAADAPLKRRDTVTGCYRLVAPASPTTIAVRIVDVAGGEHFVTQRVE
ncbi:MAG: site-specific DNA-methyltransferase [Caldilinea sp.]